MYVRRASLLAGLWIIFAVDWPVGFHWRVFVCSWIHWLGSVEALQSSGAFGYEVVLFGLCCLPCMRKIISIEEMPAAAAAGAFVVSGRCGTLKELETDVL